MKKPPPIAGRPKILQAYQQHLGEVAGFSAKTPDNHARDINHFLEAVPIRQAPELVKLTALDLTSYLTARSANCQPASLRQVAGSLRHFLNFAQQQGWIRQPLSLAVPAIACGAKNDLPAYLSQQQLDLLFASLRLCAFALRNRRHAKGQNGVSRITVTHLAERVVVSCVDARTRNQRNAKEEEHDRKRTEQDYCGRSDRSAS